MNPDNSKAAENGPYGLIRVQGTDATAFLNAQLTRRVDNLDEGQTGLAAWCNAKGRVQALFRVTRATDGYTLRLPASMVPLSLPRLRMFVLRSQVRLEEAPDPDAAGTPTELEAILAGLPEIYPETREQFLPQTLNLDQLDGIDFKKGCYPGQEIVARTQYLGQLKRSMFQATSEANGIPPGTAVTGGMSAGADKLGIVVRAATLPDGGSRLLAVLQVEAASRTDLRLALAGNPTLTHVRMPAY